MKPVVFSLELFVCWTETDIFSTITDLNPSPCTYLALSPKSSPNLEINQHVRDKVRIINVPHLSKESRTSGAGPGGVDRVQTRVHCEPFINNFNLTSVQCDYSRHRLAKRHTAAFSHPVGSRPERATLPQQQRFCCAATTIGQYCPPCSPGHAFSSRDGLHESIFSV